MANNEESFDCFDFSLTRPSLGSEGDFDDDLGVPSSVKLIDIDGEPVAIEHSDEETNGKCHFVCSRGRCVIVSFPIADVRIGSLPFNVVHSPAQKFKHFHRDVFIPGVPITATITDYERSLTTHLINPNL